MNTFTAGLFRSTRRRLATTTVGIAAIVAAGLGFVVSSGSASLPPTLTPKAVTFHDAMRALWEQHGTYTEDAIVDAVGGLANTNSVVATLLENQVNIGDAVKPYYGAKAGDELTTLLKAHINDAVATVVAAKSGNAAATEKAKAKFYANGNRIASFLHKANPRYWSLAAMKTMMRVHLNQVIGLAVDQIKGNYTAANHLYTTEYIPHILVGMADMLSAGIINQFPADFR
jgi:hypothetical protein